MIKKAWVLLKNEFLPFCIIGSIGFLMDVSIFSMMHIIFPPLPSRIISILCAMHFTWISNRTFTFKINKKINRMEWANYLMINTLGALINLNIFLLLIKNFVLFQHYFILPIAASTLVSMWFNFLMFKYHVFKKAL